MENINIAIITGVCILLVLDDDDDDFLVFADFMVVR
jgi:hypothetical protein